MYFNASSSWRPNPLAVVTRAALTKLITGVEKDDGTGKKKKNNLRKNDHPAIRASHIQAQNG